jgi:arylsulfatase A-like enzyme
MALIESVVSLALVAIGLYGCAEPEHRSTNVLLISIETLRAGHLGTYGYPRNTSPAIDRLAETGVLFENAVSQAPWTLPALASLHTSLYARTHRSDALDRRLSPVLPTLASTLRDSGFATHALVSGVYTHSRFGLNSGFDTYDDRLSSGGHQRSHAAVTSPQIHARAIGLLDSMEEPFFLFLHYWDTHYDYIPPAPFDTLFDPDYRGAIDGHDFIHNEAVGPDMKRRDLEHLLALYDGEIAWVDDHIGRLLSELGKRGLAERTMIVLTSDHGDEFFEHGQKGHQHTLYQELLHVPLIIKVPDGTGGLRVHERVGLIDVMPTILESLGVSAPSGLQGRSLLPLLRGESMAENPIVSETKRAWKSSENEVRPATALYDGKLKMIVYKGGRRPAEFYDLEVDPGERQNLDGRERHRRLSLLYREWLTQTPRGRVVTHEGLDEETVRELESLGYLEGGR